MVEISTSLLSVENGKEAEVILSLEKAKTDYYHIDVMDGKFVEKNTYQKMMENSSCIKRLSSLPLDIHLMVNDIKNATDDFLAYEPNIITFHYEACENAEEVFKYINYIKQNNCKVGISIKPNTDIQEIYKFLPFIHMILIMTVEPGKGGQTLLRDMIKKVENLKKYIDDEQIEVDIEVDGGINLTNVKELKLAGANIIVAGVAIVKAQNFKEIIDEMKK